MDLRKYWTACRLHDWLYMMSDDPEVYRNGAESEADLARIAAKSPAHMEMYEAWREHAFGAGARPAEPKLEED